MTKESCDSDDFSLTIIVSVLATTLVSCSKDPLLRSVSTRRRRSSGCVVRRLVWVKKMRKVFISSKFWLNPCHVLQRVSCCVIFFKLCGYLSFKAFIFSVWIVFRKYELLFSSSRNFGYLGELWQPLTTLFFTFISTRLFQYFFLLNYDACLCAFTLFECQICQGTVVNKSMPQKKYFR